jgi:16S rRNA processing protein RimM
VSEYFLIAKTTSVNNKDGFIKSEIYSDLPERFENLKEVYLDFWGDKKPFIVESVRKHKNYFLFKFLNFNTEREAKTLVGREIYVDEKSVVTLPENNYFLHDLIGCEVLVNDVIIGNVKDVISAPANDVLVINDVNGKEILAPFVLAFIDKIDSEKKIISLKELDLTPDDED